MKRVNKKNIYIILVTMFSTIFVLGSTYLAYQYINKPPVPEDIKKQVNFLIFYPGSSDAVKVEEGSFKFDSESKVLSFNMSINGIRTVVTQQPTPESFNDIPGYYDKIINSMFGYASFDSEVGKVNLTRPKNLENRQSIVINAKGTLMFASPEKDIDQDDWKKIINNLIIIK